MSHVPYASVVDSLMYAMVYIRLDIAHAVGVYIKTKKGSLDSSEAGFQVFAWH